MAAAYERIHNAILEQIRGGKLQPGDKLPSERELAHRYKVSLMTARHAVTLLQQGGYVTRRVGSGTFVAPATSGGQRLQDPHELVSNKLTCRVVSVQLLQDDAIRPEPMEDQSCGVITRTWSSGSHRVIDEQVWLPAGTERELRKFGTTPLLAWLATDDLFARETIEAAVVGGAAALRLTQTLFDAAQVAVAHRVAVCNGDKVRLQRIIQR